MDISFFPLDQAEGIAVEMAQVPRVGESVVLDGDRYEILSVTWQPTDDGTADDDGTPDVISEVRPA